PRPRAESLDRYSWRAPLHRGISIPPIAAGSFSTDSAGLPARPVFRLAKISQQFFFRSSPAFVRNSPQTFVDHGRAVLVYGLGRTEIAWPRRSRSPGASCCLRLPSGGDGNIKG